MDDDDLERLGHELTEDENVVRALGRLNVATRFQIIADNRPDFYWLITALLVEDPDDLRDIGSRMAASDFDLLSKIVANMAYFMEGYIQDKLEAGG